MKQQGFNLIEILLILAVTSFLFGFAAPSYQRMIEQQSQTTELARLQAVLSHARLMASLNNTKLLICNTDNGKECSTSISLNGDLLIVTDKEEHLVHFSAGAGYPIVLQKESLEIHPLPNRGSGGNLLPCTGFSQVQARGLTLSPTSRVRINNAISKDLASKCPK